MRTAFVLIFISLFVHLANSQDCSKYVLTAKVDEGDRPMFTDASNIIQPLDDGGKLLFSFIKKSGIVALSISIVGYDDCIGSDSKFMIDFENGKHLEMVPDDHECRTASFYFRAEFSQPNQMQLLSENTISKISIEFIDDSKSYELQSTVASNVMNTIKCLTWY